MLPSPRLDAVGTMSDPVDLMTRFNVAPAVGKAIAVAGKPGPRQAVYVCHAITRWEAAQRG